MVHHITYVQDYVPSYRVPLFDALAARLADVGAELTVCHGRHALGIQGLRADSAEASWSRVLCVRKLALGRAQVTVRRLPRDVVRRTDLWVTPLSAGDLTSWRCVAGRRPAVVWGHGKSYLSRVSWLADAPERVLARRANHSFTYAPGGRDALINAGVPPDRVTVVGNAADGPTLRRLALEFAPRRDKLAKSLGVRLGHTALFVGGLDGTKRIEFLVDAARVAVAADPDFTLVVGGAGPLAPLVEGAPGIRPVGRMSTDDKARWAAVASAIWNPGRVGLIALDAIAVGLPLLTTDGARHAPEIEFAVEGRDVFRLANAADEFAVQALNVMQAGERSERLGHVMAPNEVAAAMVGVLTSLLAG